jgi:hypothetical protein
MRGHASKHKHGSKDGFRLFKDAEYTGGGICNTCGAFPDGLGLIMQIKGWDFPDTLEQVGSLLGLVEQTDPRKEVKVLPLKPTKTAEERRREIEENDQRVRSNLRRVWSSGVTIDDPMAAPVLRYFARRGLSIEPLMGSPNFRFAPELDLYSEELDRIGTFPALLCGVTGPDGRPSTIHRIYMTEDGRKPEIPVKDEPDEFEKTKKMMEVPSDREVTGGCIQIGPVAKILGVAEGVENAVAVTQGTGMVCWSTVNATLMEGFVPPHEVEQLVIWADLDRSGRGRDAAMKLQQRTWEMKKKAQIQLPGMAIPDDKKGVDWENVWQQFGKSGFPNLRNQTQPSKLVKLVDYVLRRA